MPDVVSLDHDLDLNHYGMVPGRDKGDNRVPDGSDVTRWLLDYIGKVGRPYPDFRVHSMNEDGSQNILSLVRFWQQVNNVNDLVVRRVRWWER